jgi:hypothetical protein
MNINWRVESLRLIGVFTAGMSLTIIPILLFHPVFKDANKGEGAFFFFIMGMVIFTEAIDSLTGKHKGKLKSTLAALLIGFLVGSQIFFI